MGSCCSKLRRRGYAIDAELEMGSCCREPRRRGYAVDGELEMGKRGDARRWLQRLLDRVRATLRDAEQRWIKRESTALWVKDLKDLADDIEDALDDFEYEEVRCKVVEAAAPAAVGDSSRGSSSDPDNLSNQFDVAMIDKVDAIWGRFKEITEEHKALSQPWDPDVGASRSRETNSSQLRETTSLMTDPQVIGRDGVKEEIVDFLVGGTPEERLSVLAIVGIGGVGKTTLARSVYHDDRVVGCFHHRFWVHVSSNFDVTRVTRQILQHVADPRLSLHQMDNLNVLQEALAKELTDKRFLLVLDDMWFGDRVMDNLNLWELLCAPLIHRGKGSKIVVTTRSAQLAGVQYLAKTKPLSGLDFDDSWSLFKKHAFLGGDSEGHPNLEDIGKRIVQKLNGVPLAVAVIGRMLCSESEESEWTSVLESQLWEVEQGEGGILPSLRLSYEHLPQYLRPCFAYVSVFPKNFRFDKLQLIQLWMAVGHIPSHGNKRMEDVGSDYLNCLLGRSLIQNFDDKYVVHDLLHDLGRFILLNDVCAIETEKLHEITSKGQQHRHLSLDLYKQPELGNLEKLQNFKKLRTLSFVFSWGDSFQIPRSFFMNLTCLRVLHLSYGGFKELPDSIDNLRHLRYLDLSRNYGIRDLPESLCNLYMLQTLKLNHCIKLRKLPTGMSNLVNLRHLEAYYPLVTSICGIGKLVHLQKLELLSICERDEGNKVEDLKDMDELRGRLCIENLQRVVSTEEASRANLKNKKYIKNLNLEWNDDRNARKRSGEFEEAVLDALLPPPGLKKLRISGYDGVKLPSWMNHCQTVSGLESISLFGCRRVKLNVVRGSECLSKLQKLELDEIPGLKELPPLPTTLRILRMRNLGLELLPDFCQTQNNGVTVDAAENGVLFLRELEIVGCHELRALGGVLGRHLPYLAVLRIKDCKELQCWPDEEFFQATLLSLGHEFRVEDCPKLKALPEGSVISSSLSILVVHGCPDFADNTVFARLQKVLLNPHKARVSVEKQCRDLASCFEGALDQMRAVHFLNIKADDSDSDQLPFTLICRINRLEDSGAGWKVTLKISRRKSDDDENYYRCCNSALWACLRHHQYMERLPAVSLLFWPSSLRLLSFYECESLEELPPDLCTLFPSLRALFIQGCPKLRRIPQMGLPASLEALIIRDSPCVLQEEDWPKLAHVRLVSIDGTLRRGSIDDYARWRY